jgi:exopolysaccharide production protein ExoQ
MPPILAAALSVVFILYLFYVESRRSDNPSPALWVPTIWMFFVGSRHASAWLNLSPQFDSAADMAEGSPIDRAVFLALIIAGIAILVRRKVDWDRLALKNGWIILYLLYCLSSVMWTDEPAILLKRWVKDLGFPIMALVILSERKPYDAIGVVLRRLAFVMLPLSVVFIKYYPGLGRWYRVLGDGAETFTGVGQQKNDLGLICLVTGLYAAWELMYRSKEPYPSFIRQNKLLSGSLGVMLAWLLYKSNSQTSLVCLVVGIGVLLLGRSKPLARSPDALFALLFLTVMSAGLLDQALGLKELILGLLGRRPDLTERTDIWQILLGLSANPYVGVGFMSFWTGQRLEDAWTLLNLRIQQAHNGYLEQYLNLGYVGVAFIIVITLSALFKIRRHIKIDPSAGMLRLCFISVALLYNWTEASFYGLNNMWMLFLLASLERPTERAAVKNRQRYRPPNQNQGREKSVGSA